MQLVKGRCTQSVRMPSFLPPTAFLFCAFVREETGHVATVSVCGFGVHICHFLSPPDSLIQHVHKFALSPGWEGLLSLIAELWPVSVCEADLAWPVGPV